MVDVYYEEVYNIAFIVVVLRCSPASPLLKLWLWFSLSHSSLSGSCPPCPKTVSVACFCQKGGTRMRRCSSQGWSCGRICRKVLSCGFHTCEEHCHEGRLKFVHSLLLPHLFTLASCPMHSPSLMCSPCNLLSLVGSCPPCGESVEQDCVCGKESRQMQCGTESWHCSNVSSTEIYSLQATVYV